MDSTARNYTCHLLLDHIEILTSLSVLHLGMQLVADAPGLVLVDALAESIEHLNALTYQHISL